MHLLHGSPAILSVVKYDLEAHIPIIETRVVSKKFFGSHLIWHIIVGQ
jgi:hypothetical protein